MDPEMEIDEKRPEREGETYVYYPCGCIETITGVGFIGLEPCYKHIVADLD